MCDGSPGTQEALPGVVGDYPGAIEIQFVHIHTRDLASNLDSFLRTHSHHKAISPLRRGLRSGRGSAEQLLNQLAAFALHCEKSLFVLASSKKIPVLRTENPAVYTRTICLLPIEFF
jgi:hypothetical protein